MHLRHTVQKITFAPFDISIVIAFFIKLGKEISAEHFLILNLRNIRGDITDM